MSKFSRQITYLNERVTVGKGKQKMYLERDTTNLDMLNKELNRE
jgi:hypothetical protein